MRAAVLHHPAPIEQNPLQLEDLPVPSPGTGEVLLRVEACGVCRTDLHITSGELPPLRPAVTPGHQIVGHVEKLGESVNDLRVGARGPFDRVLVSDPRRVLRQGEPELSEPGLRAGCGHSLPRLR